MTLNPLNSSNLEHLALKGLSGNWQYIAIVTTTQFY